MNQKIMLLLLISMILLAGCENFSEIKKDQLMIDQIEKEEKLTLKKPLEKFTEEELKEKTLKAFKKYYNLEINEEDLIYTMNYVTFDEVKESLEEMEIEKYLQIKMDYKDILKKGFYVLYWHTSRKSETFKKRKYFMYITRVDGETGEILNISYNEYDSKKEKTNENITLEEAKQIVGDFIRKNKIFKTDKMKLVKELNKKNVWMYYFLYEDPKEATNKVFIRVNTNTKRVEEFSRGVVASIDYMKMELEE
ncbi:hypothetical protein [Crassaminicella profunda]|uniref:hypothetical protein n=1 Tax=Crassaminicella profunda TaxID=1286698 RepID=UPI001CA65506|nr:hypothetical protein [Crassaminicella profunda]QZY54110.1 hypothetical protein K7H06_13770 [Crassaminicella profunda]